MERDTSRQPNSKEKYISFVDLTGWKARGVVILDDEGDASSGSWPTGYGVYKKDDDASPNYFGFHRRGGSWVILRETLSTGNDTYEYATGSSDIETAWAGRVAASYDTYENTF